MIEKMIASADHRVAISGVPQPFGFIAFGGNRLGSALDERASFELLDAYREQGGTMIDTALVYADWLPGGERACSERMVGRWLSSRGITDEIVVTTKGGHPDVRTPAGPRLSVTELREDVERSLTHLGLDRLPLWWLHRDDPARPAAEIVASVQTLVDEGLVAAWGVCNWTATRLGAARDAAARAGQPGPVAESSAFALAAPKPGALASDLTILDPQLAGLHRETQLPLVAYSAQAKGWFDKIIRGDQGDLDKTYDRPVNRAAASVLATIADQLSATPTEVALAALRLLPFPVIAVVGPGSVEQLQSCRRAAELDLTDHYPQLNILLTAAINATERHASDAAPVR